MATQDRRESIRIQLLRLVLPALFAREESTRGKKGVNMAKCPTCKQEMKDLGEWPYKDIIIVHRWHCVPCNIFQAFPVREVKEGEVRYG
jgi:hypothetical protein